MRDCGSLIYSQLNTVVATTNSGYIYIYNIYIYVYMYIYIYVYMILNISTVISTLRDCGNLIYSQMNTVAVTTNSGSSKLLKQ